MQTTIEAGTDAALFALFDPAALKGRLGKDIPNYDRLADDGLLGTYDMASDGSTVFRVYVEEEPEAHLVKRSYGEQAGYLRVPSGRLWMIGAEYLREEDPTAAYMGGHLDCEPGLYEIRAADVHWEEGEHEQRMLELGARPGDIRYTEYVGCSFGVIFLAYLIGIPVVLIKRWIDVSFIAAMQWLGWMLLAAVVLGIVFYFLMKSPKSDRVFEARKTAAMEMPWAWIQLTRIADADEARSIRGVKFGPAYTEMWEPRETEDPDEAIAGESPDEA